MIFTVDKSEIIYNILTDNEGMHNYNTMQLN